MTKKAFLVLLSLGFYALISPLIAANASAAGAAKWCYMNSYQRVYAGPDALATSDIGSVNKNERVYVIWKERVAWETVWYRIEYTVTATGQVKGGYVPAGSISIDSNRIPLSPYFDFGPDQYIVAEKRYTAYSCIGQSRTSVTRADLATIGTVFKGDKITVYNLIDPATGLPNRGPFYYIEYRVDSTGKYKHAYIFR